MTGLEIGPSPYVGPRAFEEAEKDFFFGRDEEIAVLRGLVMARRATLFFAQSGAGKSSLLRAGLVPDLTQKSTLGRGRSRRTYQKMRVLPIAGVSGGFPERADAPVANVFIFSALLSMNPGVAPETLAGLSLADGLAPFLSTEETTEGPGDSPLDSQSSLLIFDQFEELFTHHENRRQDRETFFLQVRQALEAYPALHVLFTMREDFIARLTPYAYLLPESLRSRFRLERLDRDSALKAVIEPAARAGRQYAVGVAESLVDDLRRIQLGRAKAGERPPDDLPLGDYVEPVHLQIVCRQLWDNLPVDQTVIQAADLLALGDVDRALINFYESALASAVEQTAAAERHLRAWFEEELITPARTRGLVYQDESQTAGLDNAAVAILREAYIIRAVIRGPDTWYELAHDRLVEPILASNQEWRLGYYNPLAAATRRWQAAGREPALLLSGESLLEAAAYAQDHPEDVLEDEEAFLAESQEQARQARRRRRLLIGGAAGLVVLLALAVWAILAFRETQQEAQLARSRELALAAVSSLEIDPERSVLLALEAQKEAYTTEVENSLRQALEAFRLHQRLNLGRQFLRRIVYSPDGRVLAVAGEEGRIYIWLAGELGDDKPFLTLTAGDGGSDQVWDLAFDDAGRRLAAGYADGRVIVWDWAGSEPLATLEGHELDVYAVAFAPGGQYLVSGSADSTARIWDLETGELVANGLLDHPKGVSDVAISSSGRLLATAGLDGAVTVWDLTTGERLMEGQHEDATHAVAFNPDESLLASASQDKTVVLWEIAGERAEKRFILDEPTDTVADVAFSPYGRCLAAVSLDEKVRVWDVESGRLLLELAGHEDWPLGLAFNPAQDAASDVTPVEKCGRELATSGRDGNVLIWDIGANASGPVLLGHLEAVEAAVFSEDGRRIATAGDDGRVILWSAETLRQELAIEASQNRVNAVSVSPDGRYLATASHDGTARLWDAGSGQLLNTFDAHQDVVENVSFSPDGSLLATAGDDGVARLWSVPSGESAGALTHDQAAKLFGLRFSPDGVLLVTTGSDGMVRLWDVASGDLVWEQFHGGDVFNAAFSPDGRSLATVSWDATAKIWDVASGEEKAILLGHLDRIYGVSFSPNGATLATSSADKTIRVWDAKTGETLHVLPGPELNGLDYSPDGQRLIVGGEDGSARLFDLDLQALVELARARLTRSLSSRECSQFLHQETCPN